MVKIAELDDKVHYDYGTHATQRQAAQFAADIMASHRSPSRAMLAAAAACAALQQPLANLQATTVDDYISSQPRNVEVVTKPPHVLRVSTLPSDAVSPVPGIATTPAFWRSLSFWANLCTVLGLFLTVAMYYYPRS